jgi:hypothetical protein
LRRSDVSFISAELNPVIGTRPECCAVDKFAHASSVVFRRTPLCGLDLAPTPMRVDADEEIDGVVAAVLVIITFELASAHSRFIGQRTS